MEDDKNYHSVNLYELEKAADEYKKGNEQALREMIIPGEIIIKLYPVVQVKEDSIKRLFNGSPLFSKETNEKYIIKTGDKMSVFSGEKFIGIYLAVNSGEVFAKPEFVLQPVS